MRHLLPFNACGSSRAPPAGTELRGWPGVSGASIPPAQLRAWPPQAFGADGFLSPFFSTLLPQQQCGCNHGPEKGCGENSRSLGPSASPRTLCHLQMTSAVWGTHTKQATRERTRATRLTDRRAQGEAQGDKCTHRTVIKRSILREHCSSKCVPVLGSAASALPGNSSEMQILSVPT